MLDPPPEVLKQLFAVPTTEVVDQLAKSQTEAKFKKMNNFVQKKTVAHFKTELAGLASTEYNGDG